MDAVLRGLFAEKCPCGHPSGEHAAFRVQGGSGWPCLVPGCDCRDDRSPEDGKAGA